MKGKTFFLAAMLFTAFLPPAVASDSGVSSSPTREARADCPKLWKKKNMSDAEYNRVEARFAGMDLKEVKACFKGAKANAKGSKGITPLHFAAAYNPNPEVTKALLDAGANVYTKNDNGGIPLHAAAAYNPNPEVIKALLDAGANLYTKNDNGITPLHVAARFNPNPEVTKALLDAGAIVNAKTNNGKTPLYFATRLNPNPEVIKALLDAGGRE